jgi:uncharacterized membrane protein YbhN (UPF0104 family)
MKNMLKEKLTFLLKYLFGIALLIWILSRINRQKMLQTLLEIHWTIMVVILGIAVINLYVQYRRWKFLVEQQSSDFNDRDLIPSFFAGFTFRLLLPGGHAEITKIFMLPGKKSGKVMAFAIEKFFQTYVKTLLVMGGLPFVFPQYRWIFWTILAGLILLYPFLPRLFQARLLRRFQEKEVNYHRIFLRALLFSLGVFICLIFQYYILLNDVYKIRFVHTLLTVIYIWGAGLIPVSVSGLGIREGIAAVMLKQYGIPPAAAVGIALLVFVINAIVPAIIGVFFIYRKQYHFKDAGQTFRQVSGRLYAHGKQRWFGKQKK